MGARRTLVVLNHMKVYQDLLLDPKTTRAEHAYYVRQLKDLIDVLTFGAGEEDLELLEDLEATVGRQAAARRG